MEAETIVAGDETAEQTEVPQVTFDSLSEDELLAGIQGLVPPERNDEF